MLTDFQKRKLKQQFDFYDADDNGYIEYADYEQFAQRLAHVRGWTPGSTDYELVRQRFLTEWELLASFADGNQNERVSLDEWYAYHEHIFAVDSKFRAGEDDIVATIFDSLDLNLDGKITETEFQTFYSIYQMPAELARDVFHRLDPDDDGVITRRELRQLYHEFAYSEDPDALGNWLFGPL